MKHTITFDPAVRTFPKFENLKAYTTRELSYLLVDLLDSGARVDEEVKRIVQTLHERVSKW